MKSDLPPALVEIIEQDIARDGFTATGYHESIMRDAMRRSQQAKGSIIRSRKRTFL